MVSAPWAPGVPGFNEWTMGGVCVGDFNGDGWPDLYALKGGNGVDALYINNHNGTFSNQTAAWGLLTQHCGVGCAVGDFDRDGWQDIYVTNSGEGSKNALYRNLGNGSFQDVAEAMGVTGNNSREQGVSMGAVWGENVSAVSARTFPGSGKLLGRPAS